MTELKRSICKLCGEPMPEGEEMFNYHGRSGPCPKLPEKPKATIQPISLARRYEATGVLLNGKTAYFKYEAVPDGNYVLFTDYSAKCAETERLREALSEEQIKYMADRFLMWRFPDNFNPDGGISFEAFGNKGTRHEFKREPVGTNLLDATQALAMIRYLVDGITLAATSSDMEADRKDK